MRIPLLLLALTGILICLSGGPGMAKGNKINITGDSLVLAKTYSSNLCFDSVIKGTLILRSTYIDGKAGSIVYTEGVDFTVDYANGRIARTENSRIPDYSKNAWYGVVDFKHGDYPAFNYGQWFVYVDYETTNGKAFARTNDQTKYMTNVRRKLESGGPFKIVSYGDSISAGGEASEPDLRFQAIYGKFLQARYPKSKIEVADASIAGYTSQEGVDWFDKYLGTIDKPDLVLIGFGMNDHNMPGFGIPVDKFKANMMTIVKMIRERKGADAIIFSTMPPNEDWHYGSHRMGQYAEAAKQAAAEVNCAYADVYSVWKMVLKRKDQPSILGINHPNDFGHWLYAQAFEAVKF